MKKLRLFINHSAGTPLKKRIISYLLWVGIPLLVWDTFDMAKELKISGQFGAPELMIGLFVALIEAPLSALVAALIEHGIFAAVKTRTDKRPSSDFMPPHS